MIRLALVLVVALLLPQEKFDKSKHPWAKWKVGASATYTITVDVGGQKQEGTITYSLKELTDKGITTLAVTDFSGDKHEEEEFESLPENAGEETLTIDGKKYECTIWKSKGKKGEKETESQVWVQKGKDLPLKLVAGGEEKSEAVAVKLGEKISAGGKELECVRLEGTIKAEGTEMKATFWFSPTVPGGIVKLKMEFDAGGQTGSYALELSEFGDGKGK